MTPEQIEIHNSMYDNRTRWKYMSLRLAENELESTLTSYGCFGWELASMNMDHHHNPSIECCVVVLKQPYWIDQQQEQTDE